MKDTAVLNFTKATSHDVSSQEFEWFYWTNFSRLNPARFWDSIVSPLVQAYPSLGSADARSLKADLYASPALPMLTYSNRLSRIAMQFANEMASANNGLSHTSPSGVSFSSRMQSAGISACAGENISGGPSNPLLMLVLLYLDKGVPARGHRKTLLNPDYRQMGVGIALYPAGDVFVVQDFACLQP